VSSSPLYGSSNISSQCKHHAFATAAAAAAEAAAGAVVAVRAWRRRRSTVGTSDSGQASEENGADGWRLSGVVCDLATQRLVCLSLNDVTSSIHLVYM